jgi:hypothetical protein
VLIPAEKLPAELQRASTGVLVKLPQADFEARVQQAARAIESGQYPPRLLETRYRARLLPNGALAGTGQWKINHSVPGAGLLPITTLNLALTRARLDGADALLGELEGKELLLLVEGQGEHQAAIDWTARGEPGPAGLRFRLEVPPCPLASVELELPSDRLLELTADNGLVSASRPAGEGSRLWRVECPSRSQVDFLVRRSAERGPVAPLVLARLHTQQNINLDQLDADFDFTLDVVRGGIRDFFFDCDPALRPVSVSIRNTELETWEWQPPAGPEKAARLQFQLPEALQAGTLAVRIHCLAPAELASWRCPAVQPEGATLQDENLTLTIAPGIQVDNWQPGDFELVRLDEEPGGGQVLNLKAAGPGPAEKRASSQIEDGAPGKAAARRPRARLRLQQPQAEVREILWWQVARQGQLLTVSLAYEGLRGSLLRLPVRLPAGWKVERVEATPAGAIRQWVVVPAGEGWSRLLLEPLHALHAGQSIIVTLTLRAGFEQASATSRLPLPEIVPERNQVSETILAVGLDRSYEAQVQLKSPIEMDASPARQATSQPGKESSLMLPTAAALSRAPWGDRVPDYFYRSRQQPIRGEIVVRSREAQPGAKTEQPLFGSEGGREAIQLAPSARVDRAELVTSVPTAGGLLHRYEFTLRNWKQSTLAILLPAASQLQTVRIDDHWLVNQPIGRATSEGVALDLPVPSGGSSHTFRLTYFQETAPWQFWTDWNLSVPTLPLQPLKFERRWQLPQGLALLGEPGFADLSNFSGRPASAEGKSPSSASDRIVVVRRDRLQGIGWGLTVLFGLLVWQGKRLARQVRYFLLILWLAFSILGLLWLPAGLREIIWPPLHSGLAVAGCWYLSTAVRSRVPAPRSIAAAAFFLGCWMFSIESRSAAPGSETVWLLPSTNEARREVLVRPGLLEQLDAMINQGRMQRLGAVLLKAAYEGRAAGDHAEFQADFQAQCFCDGPVQLALPLAGIDVRDVKLDDRASVQPQVLQEPDKGYLLPIRGRGVHTIRVQFWVTLPSGDQHELHFAIPPLAQSHLTWSVPGPVQYLVAVSARGAQTVRAESGSSRLEADLGRLPACQIRWRLQGKAPAAAQLEARELYFWELRPQRSRLLGVLQYRIRQGSTDTIAMVLPPSLEVRHVDVDAWPSTARAPRLRDWFVREQGGERRLELHFQLPLSEGVQVNLELVPLKPKKTAVTMPLPRPEGVAATTADSFLAYRVDGAGSELADFAGVSAVEPQAFLTEWQATEMEDPGPPEHAFRFRRAAGSTPMLRLRIRPPDGLPRCSQKLLWRLGSEIIGFEAGIKLQAGQTPLAVLEWQVPQGLHFTGVRGPQVRSWSLTRSRLQVWLRKSVPEATLELAGWLARPASAAAENFQLPVLIPLGTLPPESSVEVVVPEGFFLKPTRLQKLAPSRSDQSRNNDLTFVAHEADYHGEFQIQPAPALNRPIPSQPAPRAAGAAQESPRRADASRSAGQPPATRAQEKPASEDAAARPVSSQAAAPAAAVGLLAGDHFYRAIAGTGLVLVLVSIASLLPWFPRLVQIILALWPEQIAMLGFAAWLGLAKNPVCLIPIALGLAARLGYVMVFILEKKRNRRPIPGSVPSK